MDLRFMREYFLDDVFEEHVPFSFQGATVEKVEDHAGSKESSLLSLSILSTDARFHDHRSMKIVTYNIKKRKT